MPNPLATSCDPTDRPEAFFAFFARDRSRIFAYIMTLLPDWNEAQDAFQETCVVLWREFDAFDPDAPGSDFFRWACSIARHRVLAHCKQRVRDREVFSERFVELIADEVESRSHDHDDRLTAMRHCYAQLPEHQRELLQVRYGFSDQADSVREYADRLGRPEDTLYKRIKRLRRTLMTCVERRIKGES